MSKKKLEIFTNLYIRMDGFQKPYPVRIFSGNIIPISNIGLPFTKDASVNFKFDTAPIYSEKSDGKVNTRFLYPYSRNYRKADKEGIYEAFANLSSREIRKLHRINTSSSSNQPSFFHREKKFIISILITIFIGLLAAIPLWIPFVCSNNSTNNQFQKTDNQHKIINNQAGNDSYQHPQPDSLTRPDTLK